jgi:hypothetical protein
MTDREAMKMALAKFEHLWEIGIDAEYKVELLPEIRVLRQALAQSEIPMSPEHLPQYIATNNIKPITEGGGGGGGGGTQPEQDKLLVDLIQEQRAEIDRLRQALAQPEQEPVCDKDPYYCGYVRCQLGKVCKNTAHPKREWVGLTDDEIEHLRNDQPWWMVRDIEAKLKEKNT